MNRPFIEGLELSELFTEEAVVPILEAHFPNMAYSAARLGHGSDVLGFDTPRSTDHDWGPKLMLFLSEAGHETCQRQIDQVLRQELPSEIHGYSANFGRQEDDTTVMAAIDSSLVNHEVQLLTVRGFFSHMLTC